MSIRQRRKRVKPRSDGAGSDDKITFWQIRLKRRRATIPFGKGCFQIKVQSPDQEKLNLIMAANLKKISSPERDRNAWSFRRASSFGCLR
jgi:hypothetical protein